MCKVSCTIWLKVDMVNQNTRRVGGRVSESSSAMLLAGTMGMRTPAEKRYAIRCSVALLIFLLWPVSLGIWAGPSRFKLLTGMVPGVIALYIVWQFKIYLKSLDELARKIQYEDGLDLFDWHGHVGFSIRIDWRGRLAASGISMVRACVGSAPGTDTWNSALQVRAPLY